MARILKDDVDGRMDVVVAIAGLDPAASEYLERTILPRLDPTKLAGWVEGLREAEASIRHLRQRLEELQPEAQGRTCPQCGLLVSGRADRIYCSSRCRVRQHRKAKG